MILIRAEEDAMMAEVRQESEKVVIALVPERDGVRGPFLEVRRYSQGLQQAGFDFLCSIPAGPDAEPKEVSQQLEFAVDALEARYFSATAYRYCMRKGVLIPQRIISVVSLSV